MVVPEGTAIKMVSAETFLKYKEALLGLTEDNLPQVTAKLVQLGLGGSDASQGGTQYFPGGGSGGVQVGSHPQGTVGYPTPAPGGYAQ